MCHGTVTAHDRPTAHTHTQSRRLLYSDCRPQPGPATSWRARRRVKVTWYRGGAPGGPDITPLHLLQNKPTYTRKHQHQHIRCTSSRYRVNKQATPRMEQYQKRNGTYLQRADLDLDALTPFIEWLGVFHVSMANNTTSIHIVHMSPPHAGYDNKWPVPRVVHLRPNPKITNEQLITRPITKILYPVTPIILFLIPPLRH